MRKLLLILLFPALAFSQQTQTFKWVKTDTIKSRTGTGKLILSDSGAYILYPSGTKHNLDSVGAGGSGGTGTLDSLLSGFGITVTWNNDSVVTLKVDTTVIGTIYDLSLKLNSADTTSLSNRINSKADAFDSLASNKGGTGRSTFAAGDMLYYSTGTKFSRLAATAPGEVLRSGITPAWGKVTLTAPNDVDGVLPRANGGTGVSSGYYQTDSVALPAAVDAKVQVIGRGDLGLFVQYPNGTVHNLDSAGMDKFWWATSVDTPNYLAGAYSKVLKLVDEGYGGPWHLEWRDDSLGIPQTGGLVTGTLTLNVNEYTPPFYIYPTPLSTIEGIAGEPSFPAALMYDTSRGRLAVVSSQVNTRILADADTTLFLSTKANDALKLNSADTTSLSNRINLKADTVNQTFTGTTTMVNNDPLSLYGAYANIKISEGIGDTAYRWVLANDGTFRLQKNTTDFSGGVTSTPILFNRNGNSTFPDSITASDIVGTTLTVDTIKPTNPNGPLVFRGGNGHQYSGTDTMGIAVEFQNKDGIPFLKIVSDSNRIGFKAGESKPPNSGVSQTRVGFTDPVTFEDDVWWDEGLQGTASNAVNLINTTLADSAPRWQYKIRVASASSFYKDAQIEIGNPAASDFEVHRIVRINVDTITVEDHLASPHSAGTRVANYRGFGAIFPVHWGWWRPGGALRWGWPATRAEVDSFTPQRIELGSHVGYANQFAKMFGNTVISGGNVNATSPASMAVNVDSGMGLIQMNSLDRMPSAYTFEALTQNAVVIGANSSGNPRVDLVYWDSAGVVRVAAGTPAGSPVAPSLPSNCLSLATVAVANGATSIAAGNITWTKVCNILHAKPVTNNNFITTASDYNINTSTVAEAIDTSAWRLSFQGLGKPILLAKNNTGGIVLQIDSSGNMGLGTAPLTTSALLGLALYSKHLTVIGGFNGVNLLQASTTWGFRHVLNNDGTMLLRWTRDGFVTGSTIAKFDTLGNIAIGTATSAGTNAQKVIAMKGSTAPTTGPAGTAQLYATASGGLAMMDSSEKVTTLTEGGIKFNGSAPSVTGGLVGWDSTNRKFLATSYLVQRSIDLTHGVITADVIDSSARDGVGEFAVDSIPMAANFPSVGKIVQIHLFGTYTTTANQSFTIIIRHGLGGEVIDSVQRAATNPGHTGAPFEATFTGTFRSLGSSGTMVGHTSLESNGLAQASVPQGVVTVNTTVLNTLYVYVKLNSAAATNKLTVRQAWAETKN